MQLNTMKRAFGVAPSREQKFSGRLLACAYMCTISDSGQKKATERNEETKRREEKRSLFEQMNWGVEKKKRMKADNVSESTENN